MVRDRDGGENRSGSEKRRMSLDYENPNKKVDRGDSRGRYENNYGNNQRD